MAPRKLSELDDEELQAELDRRKPAKTKSPAKKVVAKKSGGKGIVRIFEMDEDTYSRTHGSGSGKHSKPVDDDDEIDDEEDEDEEDQDEEDEEPEDDEKKGSRYFRR